MLLHPAQGSVPVPPTPLPVPLLYPRTEQRGREAPPRGLPADVPMARTAGERAAGWASRGAWSPAPPPSQGDGTGPGRALLVQPLRLAATR